MGWSSKLRVQAAFGLIGALLVAFAAIGAPTPSQVEAVFLFNFSQFVEWPPQAFSDDRSPIVIGVLGNDPFGPILDDVVRDEVVNGRALTVRRFRSAEEATNCHILFVSGSEQPHLQQVLERIRGRNILTVSDMDHFTSGGGVIRFVTSDNRIRLRINLQAAKEANLVISSKLLRPSQIVADGED